MIRKIRTPRIVDDGHGWASDATAVRKAEAIAAALRFPKGWMDEYCGRSEFELAPIDVITSVPMSDSEPLHRVFSEWRIVLTTSLTASRRGI